MVLFVSIYCQSFLSELAVLGYASYLRQRRKGPGVEQGKKYAEGRVRSSTVSAV